MTRYGRHHRWKRKMWGRRITANGGIRCWRCREMIYPGQPWDLGHYDNSEIHAGPEHRACNSRAAGLKAAALRRNP